MAAGCPPALIHLPRRFALPTVALVVTSNSPFDHAALGGVYRYAQAVGWHLKLVRIARDPFVSDVAGLEPDGLIFRGGNPGELSGLSIPMVRIGFIHNPTHHSVAGDDRAAGVAVARHFHEQRFRQLVYFNRGDMRQSTLRARGFTLEARQLGIPCFRFLIGERTRRRGKWQLDDQLADLADLLRDLPKPIGLFAADDTHGERTLQACQLAGLDVPQDVAIVVQSTDTYFCELSNPPLSSIAADPERIGREAGDLLDRLMQSGPMPPTRILVPPEPLVVRASSNYITVADPLVDEALRLIRERIADLPDVDNLVELLPTSRPTLERRFRQVLGRSPAQELRRARLQTACQLLRQTDHPLVEVAIDAGFGGTPQFCRQFKQETGLTPRAYRRQFRFR